MVQRELSRWRQAAGRIPDPTLRSLALAKLDRAAMHAKVAAILATLAPRRHRDDVIVAQVALEVAYDWLDELTEAATIDQGMRLHQALVDGVAGRVAGDYFATCPELRRWRLPG